MTFYVSLKIHMYVYTSLSVFFKKVYCVDFELRLGECNCRHSWTKWYRNVCSYRLSKWSLHTCSGIVCAKAATRLLIYRRITHICKGIKPRELVNGSSSIKLIHKVLQFPLLKTQHEENLGWDTSFVGEEKHLSQVRFCQQTSKYEWPSKAAF